VIVGRYARALETSNQMRGDALALARGYFGGSLQAIITADAGGVVRQVNRQTEKLFGYGPDELVGHELLSLAPERMRDRIIALRERYLKEGQSRVISERVELVGLRKDASEFPIEISVDLVTVRKELLFVIFASDATERRSIEREARRTETLSALGAVAAGIAHELNNPLAVIASRVEVMLMSGRELPPELRDDLSVLQRNVVRATRISQNLLALASQRPAPVRSIDLNAAVEEAIMWMGGAASPNALKFDLALDRKLAPVMADSIGIAQVLINLISNARDAGAHSVRFETEAAPDRPGVVRMSVVDDGGGIAPEVAANLFNPFYTTKSKGTGLGLWLSRRIIQNFGGTIELASGDRGGAIFIITLPALDPSRAIPDVTAAAV
jgi:two-component system sensor kinase FixL